MTDNIHHNDPRNQFANPHDQEYFEWLAGFVFETVDDDPSNTYWCLLSQMHQMPFAWYIPNDDNRASDGKDFRREYQPMASYGWGQFGPCSMLEMILGLARRMDFMIGEDTSSFENYIDVYFIELMQNCGLDVYTDDAWDDCSEGEVRHILEGIINHTYDSQGNGGLFPLAKPARRDMSQEELWYQLCAYVNENMEY